MLIKGEKYACDACVRGHRVSSCQHTDRPLIHINKKGRPVSQCPHCRGLRKARAQHVKCDCAEKAHTKEDCPHDTTESKDHRNCCCGHGARCSCAAKKEHLDTVPEDIPHAILAAALPKELHKPRLTTAHSQESKLTVFSNGHHKPVHKINDIHNKCGAPYKIPARAHNLHDHKEMAQRSSDSLPLIKDAILGPETPQYHTSITSAPQPVRPVKSEHASPDLSAVESPGLEQPNNITIPPLDPKAYSYSPFGSGSPALPSAGNSKDSHFPDPFPDNYFVTYEMANNDWEPPLHSGGLSEAPSEVDWSTFNFTYDGNNGFDANNGNVAVPSQPPSYASFDHFSHLSHPGLTSSSGEISEVEDYVPVRRPNTMTNNSQDALNDFNSVGGDEISDREVYRLSSASSYVGMPQANMLASANLESLDIDEYLKSADAQTREMALNNQRQQQQQQQQRQPQIKSEPELFDSSKTVVGEHPYSIQEAQQFAHMGSNPLVRREMTSTPLSNVVAADPIWSYRPHETLDRMIDAKDQDDEWVR